MNLRQAAQQALEALELLAKYESPLTKWQVRKPRDGGPMVTVYPHQVASDGVTALRAALAEPEQDDPSPQFAHRLAIMLECALLDPHGSWDEAHKTLDEYRAAVQKWHEAHGEPYVSAFGKD